jgi:hypothetical protein
MIIKPPAPRPWSARKRTNSTPPAPVPSCRRRDPPRTRHHDNARRRHGRGGSPPRTAPPHVARPQAVPVARSRHAQGRCARRRRERSAARRRPRRPPSAASAASVTAALRPTAPPPMTATSCFWSVFTEDPLRLVAAAPPMSSSDAEMALLPVLGAAVRLMPLVAQGRRAAQAVRLPRTVRSRRFRSDSGAWSARSRSRVLRSSAASRPSRAERMRLR